MMDDTCDGHISAIRAIVMDDLGLDRTASDDDLRNAVFRRLSGRSPGSLSADATLAAATALLSGKPVPKSASDAFFDRYASELISEFGASFFDLAPRDRRAQYDGLMVDCRFSTTAIHRLNCLEPGLDVVCPATESLSDRQRLLCESLQQVFLAKPDQRQVVRHVILRSFIESNRFEPQEIEQLVSLHEVFVTLDLPLVRNVWLLATGNKTIAALSKKQARRIDIRKQLLAFWDQCKLMLCATVIVAVGLWVFALLSN